MESLRVATVFTTITLQPSLTLNITCGTHIIHSTLLNDEQYYCSTSGLDVGWSISTLSILGAEYDQPSSQAITLFHNNNKIMLNFILMIIGINVSLVLFMF
ncbi:hypothetical protein DFJ63DRAFT_159519 [Scheffersomyces coipomensis]|uniref:uncharacterized protein n=1 Tax=Scheffersomyces coipomensis TaxID=1788519 RepID=UPI00315CE324